MENTDTSEGEERKSEFRAVGSASQSLVAYAVAGVGLAAVLASAVMFLSHYPTSVPLHDSEAGGDRSAQAPVRLVSPRAMTAEEMRPEGAASEPSSGRASALDSPPMALAVGSESTEQAPAVEAPPALAEVPVAPADPALGTDTPAARPSSGDDRETARPEPRIVSTTLVSETRSAESAPRDAVELVRVEESLALQESAPGQEERGGPDATLIEVLASTDTQAPAPVDVDSAETDAPSAEPREPTARERARPYPGVRHRFLPPMPPYPPVPPYMQRGLGPGGYYPMNTASSGD